MGSEGIYCMVEETNRKDLSVSIIIPTYNEEKDIEETIKSLLNLTYRNKEIIIVDDSTDKTPSIIKRYKSLYLKLFLREKNEGGRCGARNFGILKSKGEILIILNADVLLPKDFIEQILPHYHNGADYVLVNANAANTNKLFARYVDAQSHFLYDGQDWIEWTEGFSCRKSAALDIGLFPITPIPLVAGEDGYFGEQLKKKRYKKVIDRTIMVTHVAPDEFNSYWRARKERQSSLSLYFLYKKSFAYIFIKKVILTLYSIFYIGLIFPILFQGFRLQKYSSRKMKDLFPFVYCAIVERLANLSGGWGSVYTIFKYILKKISHGIRH